MRDESDADIQTELEKAKEAQRKWSKEARLLDYKDFRQFIKNDEAGEQFCQLMDRKGFIVSSRPMGNR